MIGEIIIQVDQQPTETVFDFEERTAKYEKIFSILIRKGALDGVRGGSANIHFDETGNFQGVELRYWPYREKRVIHS